MLTKEVLKNIRRIQIVTSRMVSNVFAGQYQSVFKGRGMEFDEVREYQPGDEIRSIDWNVTARMDHPYIKKFVEERELTVMLLLDVSASCAFASSRQLKSRLGAEICSLLAFSAIRNNDKVGLIIFSAKVEKFVPPRKGLRHILRIIREALYFKPRDNRSTDINAALEYLNRVARRKAVCFMISDFYAPDFKKTLALTNKRHDLVAISLSDPLELNLPNAGIVRFQDRESGKDFLLDTGDEALRREYALTGQKRMKERAFLFGSCKVDMVDIRTDVSYQQSLFKFFRARERRMG